MAGLKARIEVSLFAVVPMAHERNLPFLGIAETRAGKCFRRQRRVFLVNRKLRIIRWRVQIVIAVLVVENKWVAEFTAGVGETLHTVPTARDFRRRQRIGMLAVVAEMRPAGNENQRAINTAGLQFLQLLRALVESKKFVVIRRIVAV